MTPVKATEVEAIARLRRSFSDRMVFADYRAQIGFAYGFGQTPRAPRSGGRDVCRWLGLAERFAPGAQQ